MFFFSVDLTDLQSCTFFLTYNDDCVIIYSELKKLSDENLAKEPDEVFDIICKIGRG